MLGIAFVMAKQWVESHSKNEGGDGQAHERGRQPRQTQARCYNDNMGCMRPDGENWQLIRGCFDRRMQGMGQKGNRGLAQGRRVPA